MSGQPPAFPAQERPSLLRAEGCSPLLSYFLHTVLCRLDTALAVSSAGAQVKALHLYFNKGEDLAESKDLSMSLQICSATITELYLAPLDITAGFDEYTMLKVWQRSNASTPGACLPT